MPRILRRKTLVELCIDGKMKGSRQATLALHTLLIQMFELKIKRYLRCRSPRARILFSFCTLRTIQYLILASIFPLSLSLFPFLFSYFLLSLFCRGFYHGHYNGYYHERNVKSLDFDVSFSGSHETNFLLTIFLDLLSVVFSQ